MSAVTIVAAACVKNGLTFTMPPPARHHHILQNMPVGEQWTVFPEEQGFLTSEGKFVSRFQAAAIAIRARQILEPQWGRELFSEDLW